MSTEKINSIAQMSNDQRLALIKRNALSIASAIQDYQDMKLKMISDREYLYDNLDIDFSALKYAFMAIEQDLDNFIEKG